MKIAQAMTAATPWMTAMIFGPEPGYPSWGYRMHYGPAFLFGRPDRRYMRVIRPDGFSSRDAAIAGATSAWQALKADLGFLF